MKTRDKLAVVALVGLTGGVCTARAEDNTGEWQVQSVQTIILDQKDANGAATSCTIKALVPQGTTKKLSFRGEYNCTGPVDIELDIYEDIAADNGMNATYNLTRQYLQGKQSGGYTAYERFIDDFGPAIVSTKVEAVACTSSGACTPWLYAQSTGAHLE